MDLGIICWKSAVELVNFISRHRSDMVNCPDQRKTQDTCFWSSTNSDDVRLAFKRGLRYRMLVTACNALNTTQSDEIVVDPDTIGIYSTGKY